MRGERAPRGARTRIGAGDHVTRIPTQRYLECYVLADGTKAATAGNGDFGTSPIFGQLSDKPQLARICL
jgi:hypothetical protein